MRTSLTLLVVACLGFIAACSGPVATDPTDPDTSFGHRYEGQAPDGYNVVTISVPEEELEFAYFPATFDHVIVRPDLMQLQTDTVHVEILVKGSLPDACMELHAFDQERTGNMVTATLQMRRPQSRVCASVRRPYRLYLMLEDGFVQGHYTLKLNDSVIPFVVEYTESD